MLQNRPGTSGPGQYSKICNHKATVNLKEKKGNQTKIITFHYHMSITQYML